MLALLSITLPEVEVAAKESQLNTTVIIVFVVEQRFDPIQDRGQSRYLLPISRNPGSAEQQHGSCSYDFFRQFIKPAVDDIEPVLIQLFKVVAFDDIRRKVRITGLQGMQNRLVDQFLALKPGAGPLVQLLDVARFGLPQKLVPQQGFEQMMIAKPDTLSIERKDEKVVALQSVDIFPSAHLGSSRGCLRTADRLNDIRAEAIQDGGLQ